MIADEEIAWLMLARSKNIGPITFHALLQKYGTARNALLKINSSFDHIVVPNLNSIKGELNMVSRVNAKLIHSIEPEYPKLLHSVRDRPPSITALGNFDLLQSNKSIAIVGARNCSYNGAKFAQELSCNLARKGFTIVSGLANGIDTASHRITQEQLPTIAVMATGINIVYPRQNYSLYQQIINNGGLIITEFPYGATPKPRHFPQRNRIISGLSLGVIVIEAGIKSGSLITARLALSQGREVFSVPGSPLDTRCHGTNCLLKEGATLVESSEDVINALGFMNDKRLSQHNLLNDEPCVTNELESIKLDLLSQLTYTPNHIDELIAHLNIDISKFLATLSELEIENRIERHTDDRISLKAKKHGIS